MVPSSGFGSEDGVEHDVAAFAAGIDAFPGHCVLVLLLPSLGDEAVDLGSACEAEPIRALASSLLELDGLVPIEFGSAETCEHLTLLKNLAKSINFLGSGILTSP